jgi:hypothetical protein
VLVPDKLILERVSGQFLEKVCRLLDVCLSTPVVSLSKSFDELINEGLSFQAILFSHRISGVIIFSGIPRQVA